MVLWSGSFKGENTMSDLTDAKREQTAALKSQAESMAQAFLDYARNPGHNLPVGEKLHRGARIWAQATRAAMEEAGEAEFALFLGSMDFNAEKMQELAGIPSGSRVPAPVVPGGSKRVAKYI